MQLDSFKQLEQCISESDYILIGLGEEWVLTEQEIEDELEMKEPVLYELYKTVRKNETYRSLLELFHAYFYQNYIPGRLEQAYNNLLQLVNEKNYFIVSLTVDSYLERAGFSEERYVNPCGTYKLLQCNNGCAEDLYSSQRLLDEFSDIILQCNKNDPIGQGWHERILQQCMECFSSYKCTKCDAKLSFNMLDSAKYREEGYLEKWQSYMKWLQGTLNKNLCVIECGVGMKLPSVIRWPFEKTVFYNQKAKMIRIHKKFYQINEEVAQRAYACKANAVQLFADENVEAF